MKSPLSNGVLKLSVASVSSGPGKRGHMYCAVCSGFDPSASGTWNSHWTFLVILKTCPSALRSCL